VEKDSSFEFVLWFNQEGSTMGLNRMLLPLLLLVLLSQDYQ
jgi:hypothetical protein